MKKIQLSMIIILIVGFVGISGAASLDINQTGVTLSGTDGIKDQTGSYVTIPPGGIIMWSGTISTIPSGWALCNGANGTPNLTDRFVIPADADSGGTNNIGSGGLDSPTSWTTNTSVGNHTLTAAEMPSHTHGDGSLTTNTTGAHVHSDIGSAPSYNANSGPDSKQRWSGTHNTGSAGNHSHTISGSTGSAGSGGAHSHPTTQDTYAPKYYALAYIMKL